jgi:hypothetical protein
MKKIIIIFVLFLASCTESIDEVATKEPIAPRCYKIISYCDGITDWIMVDVNGTAEKYEVSNIKDYRNRRNICDLSILKRLPL